MCISVLVQHDYSDNRTCEGCLSVIYDAEKIGIVQIKDVRKNNDTAMWLKVVRKSPCYPWRRIWLTTVAWRCG